MRPRPLVVFFLIFISFFCYGAASLDKIVAIVNKEVITWSELYRAMEFELSQQMVFLGDDEKMKQFKEREFFFLRTMVDLKLQMQEADRKNISVSPDEITEAINNIKRKYSLNDASFNETLKKEGFALEEYKEKLSEQITLSKLVAQEVTSRLSVEDAEVERYIGEHNLRPEDITKYRLFQIFFKGNRKDADRDAAEQKAHEALRRLEKGEEFSSVARSISEDPSGKSGGDLGYIKGSELAKEFINALEGMKPGDISRPFWTEGGLHIVKLTDKSGPGNGPEFKSSVKDTLMEEQFSKLYKNWLRGLRERAYIEIKL
jgi:peptidyl-prolyl cis-trans isomerase SurA